jgi:hypothetical protein
MNGFNYYKGIQEDFGNMISEIGMKVDIRVPKRITDTFGNLVDIKFKNFTECIWIREVEERLDVEGIGSLNREDIRFVARHDTVIVPESEIQYNGDTYIVLGLDTPKVNSQLVNRVGYAKRKLS